MNDLIELSENDQERERLIGSAWTEADEPDFIPCPRCDEGYTSKRGGIKRYCSRRCLR